MLKIKEKMLHKHILCYKNDCSSDAFLFNLLLYLIAHNIHASNFSRKIKSKIFSSFLQFPQKPRRYFVSGEVDIKKKTNTIVTHNIQLYWCKCEKTMLGRFRVCRKAYSPYYSYLCSI